MLWVILTVLATLFWAVVNIVDKFTVMKWVRNPLSPMAVTSTLGAIAAIVIYTTRGFSPVSSLNIALCLASGLFYTLACLLYMKAVKIEEISRVVPLFYISSLFVMVLAAVIVGEIFTPIKYLGIVLLVAGAMAVSSKGGLRLNKAFMLMLLADLALAPYIVLAKYAMGFTDFWTVFSYVRFGALLATIPIFFFAIPDLRRTAKEHGIKAIGIITFSSFLNIAGVALITVATAIGFVTLVEALSGIQALFVLALTLLLGAFLPRIIKEEGGKRVAAMKLLAIIMMLVGAAMIT